jgi:hypothetical protein
LNEIVESGGWAGTPNDIVEMASELLSLPARWREDSSLETWFPLTAEELRNWRTWGVIEIAIRNPNVNSYMKEWEGRALKAEKELKELHAAFAESIEARAK